MFQPRVVRLEPKISKEKWSERLREHNKTCKEKEVNMWANLLHVKLEGASIVLALGISDGEVEHVDVDELAKKQCGPPPPPPPHSGYYEIW